MRVKYEDFKITGVECVCVFFFTGLFEILTQTNQSSNVEPKIPTLPIQKQFPRHSFNLLHQNIYIGQTPLKL